MMQLVRTHSHDDGSWSVTLTCETPVDSVVEAAGHTPNGYFWEGVAQLLVSTEAKHLEDRFSYDPEGSMFSAYGRDAAALAMIGELIDACATDEQRIRSILATADEIGFVFDD